MEKKVIQEIILWQQGFIRNIKLQKRDIRIEPTGNYVFVGIRRAGKTFMLYQHIQQLLNEGHDIREILFVNFEDERIVDMKKEDLHILIDAYRELFAHEPIVFLDEETGSPVYLSGISYCRMFKFRKANIAIYSMNANSFREKILWTTYARKLSSGNRIRRLWTLVNTIS